LSSIRGSAVQFLLFAGVGTLATVGQYAILMLLVDLVGTTPVVASSVAFAASATLNYALNYRVTFKSKKRHAEALVKFSTVACGGLVLNAGIMSTLVHGLAMHYLKAQFLATALVLVWNFFANRMWTFRPVASKAPRPLEDLTAPPREPSRS
jgi:putative flippase GtrA